MTTTDTFCQRTIDRFNAVDGDLRGLFRRASEDLRGIDPAGEMLSGCVSAGLALIAGSARNGVQYTGLAEILTDRIEFSLALNRAFHARDFAAADELLEVLADALERSRPFVGLATLEQRAIEDAPPQEPMVQRVEIVALPERRTTTQIERGSAGDITSSVQIERDAVV